MPRKDFIYLSERHKRRLLCNQLIAYQQTKCLNGPNQAGCPAASDSVPANNDVDCDEFLTKFPHDTRMDINDNVTESDGQAGDNDNYDNCDVYENDYDHADSEIMDNEEIQMIESEPEVQNPESE